MFYFVAGLVFFIIQSYLTLATNINLWPEFFFIPWMISKGAMPYRDFFTHHGFLLYYFLAPFTYDKTLLPIKIIYFLVVTINLFLVLLILKRTTDKKGFLIGGLLYVILIYFVSENNFWDELVITTFYLVIYWLTIGSRSRKKIIIMSLLSVLASFIKPTAAVIILPLFLVYKDILMILVFSGLWLVVFIYTYMSKFLFKFIENLFLFNRFFPLYILSRPIRLYDKKFLLASFFILFTSLFLLFKKKKLKNNLNLIFITFCSAFFLFPMYERTHLTPFITFLALLVGSVAKLVRKAKHWFLILLFSYFVFIINLTGKHYIYLRTKRIPYIENKNSREITEVLKKEKLNNKKIYILGNQVEIYYFINQLPSTYFPLVLPGFADYYQNIQDMIWADINKNRIEIIIIPYPLEKYYQNLNRLVKIIQTDFLPIVITNDYKIYSRINKN